MAAKVKVQFSHPHRMNDRRYSVGDEASVTPLEARELVSAGVARPVTVSEAKKADVEPETAASKQ